MSKFLDTIRNDSKLKKTPEGNPLILERGEEYREGDDASDDEEQVSLSKELLKFWERPSIAQDKLKELLIQVSADLNEFTRNDSLLIN